MVDITGLDKAEILKALHDGTRALGMGMLHDIGPAGLPIEKAREYVSRDGRLYFDYVHGRPLKVDLSGDEFDPYLYDRDSYAGAAEGVINNLRTSTQQKESAK